MKKCIKCGSHAFNLYAEKIDQGGLCDVHYWQGRAHRAEAQPEQEQKCWCTTCRPITMSDMRFVVCPDCGNKRCPKANDHCNACTGSNEVGQKGSSWEHVKPLAQPEQGPWMYRIWNDKDAQWRLTDDCSWPAEPIYTTPPKRPWVGLTTDELKEVADRYHLKPPNIPVALRAIEDKLKELNT